MSKKCPYSRKRMEKNPKWKFLIDGENVEENLKKEGFSAYHIISDFWMRDGMFDFYYVEDKIYDWIEKNYNRIKVVAPSHHERPIEKVWVQKISEHDKSKLIDTSVDKDYYLNIAILFKEKTDAAKFKILYA